MYSSYVSECAVLCKRDKADVSAVRQVVLLVSGCGASVVMSCHAVVALLVRQRKTVVVGSHTNNQQIDQT